MSLLRRMLSNRSSKGSAAVARRENLFAGAVAEVDIVFLMATMRISNDDDS